MISLFGSPLSLYIMLEGCSHLQSYPKSFLEPNIGPHCGQKLWIFKLLQSTYFITENVMLETDHDGVVFITFADNFSWIWGTNIMKPFKQALKIPQSPLDFRYILLQLKILLLKCILVAWNMRKFRNTKLSLKVL